MPMIEISQETAELWCKCPLEVWSGSFTPIKSSERLLLSISNELDARINLKLLCMRRAQGKGKPRWAPGRAARNLVTKEAALVQLLQEHGSFNRSNGGLNE